MAVHKDFEKKVVSFLRQLGLPTDEISAYLYLVQNGPQTVLALSRGLKTGRTKLYPLLDQLAAKGLVAIRERHYGTTYQARPPAAIEHLLITQEQTSQSLRTNLPIALEVLREIQAESPATSKIVEYSGIDGLKEMRWNLAKSKQTYRVFEPNNMDKGATGKHFDDKMRHELDGNGIKGYYLVNKKPVFTASKPQRPLAQFSYIAPEIFNIEYETYIYGNIVGLLKYDGKNLTGVEIHNNHLASQQRQFFNLLWKQAVNPTVTP